MKVRHYLNLLRIRNWLGYFLIATFGFVISKGYTNSFIEVFLFYIILIFYLGFSFSINNCFDVKEDRLKLKKNPIATGKLIFKNSFFFSIILAALGIALSMFFGLKVFLFYLILTLLSFFYSSPPLRFKSRFLLDIISHGLFFGALLFLLPLVIFGSITLFHYIIAFFIFYFSVMLELRNHIEDYESDKKAGLKTTACTLGVQETEKLLYLLALFYPIILFLVFISQFLLPFLIITFIFYMSFLLKRRYRILDVYSAIGCCLLVLGVSL